ncbi:MAG: PAS domain-containing protein [Ktedonobacteraceae bacterium]|nr:PAS domain-containing protein [Ktedonobacteraceae bacterium]
MAETEITETGQGELIVIGSSAGGVEAVSILVSTLPANFPAPIVLAQHLDPTRASSLDSILRRRSALPVELVTTTTRLEPGKIYVTPSNRFVSILDGHVEVQEDNLKQSRPRPSVDVLFSSAAKAYGDRLIAVILTGSGSDGATGAVEVKNAGGIVIVQDPQTARYPSMPAALPPTIIDFGVDIEHIGPLLYTLLTGGTLPHSEEKPEDGLRNILEQVNHQACIDFRPYKISTILRRIGRRMAVTHNRSMREYLEYLKMHPDEVGALVKAFLINVTQFFRDPDAFAYLKSDVLPKLIAHAREHERSLRFWTAGCATGEEPYSLAMLLTDLLGSELPEWSIKIFATDLDEAAINFGRRGVYSENLLKGVPGDYHDRFFEHTDHSYRILKILRQMVIFGQQNLTRSAPFPRIDLLLCRNVLIYFTPELQEYVLNQFTFSLAPDGYLFLGKAETVRPSQTYFELVNKHWKIYRCVGSSLSSTRHQNPAELYTPRLEGRTIKQLNSPSGKQHADLGAPAPALEIGQLRRLNELLLRFLPISVVVINRAYHILTANGTARRLLGLRDVGSEQDFLHAIRGIPYSPVRNAIDTVFRERTTITLSEVEFDTSTGGNGRFVSLSIAPMQLDAGMPDLAVISVTDVTEQIQIRQQLEAAQAEQTQLMSELAAANKRLSDMNKELVDSNEELQVANEELVLAHEELQATIEEFETTNEELQATNEELETNNEELQATNEELETTNDELRARTSELQELTNMLEGERKQLSAIVELAPFYIMMLRGPSLIVETYSHRYEPLVEGKTVQGRPLDEVLALFWESGVPLARLAREVYQHDLMRITSRIPTHLSKDGEPVERYFVYTLVPSHDANGRVSGVIIYTLDETEQHIRETEQERERLRLIFDNANAAALALYDAQTAELIMGSPRYLDIVAQVRRLERRQLIGGLWYDLNPLAVGEAATELWNTVLESRVPFQQSEVHLQLAADEAETVWRWHLAPILDKERQHTVRYMLVSAVEITEQIRAQQEMERLNRAREDFLALASHELRNPLTSIQGFAQLLQRRLQHQPTQLSTQEVQNPNGADISPQQVVQALDRIIYQVKRLQRLIEEMVDITRIGGEVLKLNKQPVDIVEVVRRAVETVTASTDRVITVQGYGEAIIGNWDESRLEQVMNNLFNNAIKYSPSGTPVEVGIERQPDDVLVWVRDKGQGISQEDQAHIFDRFYRIHNVENKSIEGLGLGLYIAYYVITEHGGRIWVESKQGEGSTFSFSLPYNQVNKTSGKK